MVNKTLFKFALAALAVMAVIPVAGEIAPGYEGKNYPVTAPVKVETIKIYDSRDGWIYFSMSTPKLRECSWRNTVFYVGRRSAGLNAIAPFEHLEGPQVRGIGDLFWEKNRTRLSEFDLLNFSYADVYHQCQGWWRFWQTRTPFYDAPEG